MKWNGFYWPLDASFALLVSALVFASFMLQGNDLGRIEVLACLALPFRLWVKFSR